MTTLIPCLAALVLAGCLALLQIPAAYEGEGIRAYVEKSGPYIGTGIPRVDGGDGTGIRVAVIDTGVDFNHPDLLGWGEGGKVVGGYNFVHRGQPPMDTNGHGTQVAGIIAADGHVKGIAPKAEILAYKVSEDGEGVSEALITRAIDRAIGDGADVINISLGVNVTSSEIERAVNRALDEEIFVVTAAGNDGPDPGTIGSPGMNLGSITVGATYNNLTSSLVATLDAGGRQYTVIPMLDSANPAGPITGEVVFGGYGKEGEMEGVVGASGSIVLVQRGSDIEGEMLYFSIKEANAAEAGAAAMIVYNNGPGIFLGELSHEFVEPGYAPRIPVVSISMEDGLEIREMIEGGDGDGVTATMDMFYNPDFVAHFSSRGPVSPFYIKPEIVAPGAYINTTRINAEYGFASGTSYAAPHVSGAAAVLLQKNPGLLNDEIKALLMTTSEPVSDPYGHGFTVHDAGAGRVDLASAYGAGTIVTPPSLVVGASPDSPAVTRHLQMKAIDEELGDIDVRFDGDGQIRFSYERIGGGALRIVIGAEGADYGDHEGRIVISDGQTTHSVPLLLHYTQGSVTARLDGQTLLFDVSHPDGWDFAKITVTDSDGERERTVTATPDRDASMRVYGNAQYWIDARITSGGGASSAFDTISVDVFPEDHGGPRHHQQHQQWPFAPLAEGIPDIAARQFGMIVAAAALTGIVGMALSRRGGGTWM